MFEFHDRFRWGEIEVIEGLIFEPADPFSRPFAWVSSMFDYRARLFRADKKDVRATSIKLALNSMESSRKASAAPHGAEFCRGLRPASNGALFDILRLRNLIALAGQSRGTSEFRLSRETAIAGFGQRLMRRWCLPRGPA